MQQFVLTVASVFGIYYAGNWLLKIYRNHKKYEELLEKQKVVPFPRKLKDATDSTDQRYSRRDNETQNHPSPSA